MESSTSFMIRKKADGSLDSICLSCFQTVAAFPNCKSKAAVQKADEAHVCPTNLLVQRELYESKVSKYKC